MIKNYILLFVRNLKRQKLFSVINLLGLTVSIASTLIIYFYVAHEFSYDSFHPNVDRLYRVNQTSYGPPMVTVSSRALARALPMR